ncbi:MAG: hypothetical protein JSV84_17575, partial [Gemmatimonadota bacterium]
EGQYIEPLQKHKCQKRYPNPLARLFDHTRFLSHVGAELMDMSILNGNETILNILLEARMN